MSDENKRFLDHLGVTAWHAAGWTGSRGLTATTEVLDGSDDHAANTLAVFRLIAPDRKVIRLRTGSNIIDGVTHHRLIEESVPEIIRQHVDTMYSSEVVDNMCDVSVVDAGLEPVKDFCSIFYGIGNYYSKEYSKITESKYIFGVGAYYLMAGTNEMRPAYFSSVSEHVDFSAPTLINQFSGTSCATPCLCGMAALVNDMAIAVTGRPLSQDGMHRFLADCAVDIGAEGFDTKAGYGAPILPDPAKIDIWAYQSREDKTMYKDDDKIPDWAREDVYYCKEIGLMQGDADGSFRPDDPVTRAELACALARLRRDMDK